MNQEPDAVFEEIGPGNVLKACCAKFCANLEFVNHLRIGLLYEPMIAWASLFRCGSAELMYTVASQS